jgi:glycine oxidase
MSERNIQAADVVIIGGGVIGSAIAYNLRRANVDVLVVERAEVASEASSAAAGLLSPLAAAARTKLKAHTDLLMASWAMYADLIPTLEELSGVHVEYDITTALHTVTAANVARLREQFTFWESSGIDVTWLSGDEARAREPYLSSDVAAAVYNPQEGGIRPSAMTRAFAGAARKLGARFLERTEIIGLQSENSRVTGVQTALGDIISCNQLIIATGAWSARCGNWLGLTIPVRPTRGQILSLHQPTTPLKHILLNENLYIAPKMDNTIFVGATIEDVGFDKSNTVEGVEWILSNILKHTPQLASARIANIWAGLRPGSPDRDPILGKAPGWENVTLATGHSGTGFEMCAITGQSIAELITTGQAPAIIQPFGIERFQLKA